MRSHRFHCIYKLRTIFIIKVVIAVATWQIYCSLHLLTELRWWWWKNWRLYWNHFSSAAGL